MRVSCLASDYASFIRGGELAEGTKFVLLNLIKRFDRYHEYIFLLSIGWCLGMAELAIWMGLSAEIGAFIAGISIASSPIAQYIAISLKPLRDFLGRFLLFGGQWFRHDAAPPGGTALAGHGSQLFGAKADGVPPVGQRCF